MSVCVSRAGSLPCNFGKRGNEVIHTPRTSMGDGRAVIRITGERSVARLTELRSPCVRVLLYGTYRSPRAVRPENVSDRKLIRCRRQRFHSAGLAAVAAAAALLPLPLPGDTHYL